MLIYFIIGLIQGLTEFLPVSSSGHLVLIENIIDYFDTNVSLLEIDSHFLNVMVHFGTMIAVIIVFRKKIWQLIKEFFKIPYHIKNEGFKNTVKRPDTDFIIAVIIGTIPTVIIGFFIRDFAKSIENNLLYVGIFFLLTAFVLFLSTLFDKGSKKYSKKIGVIKAFIIGITQGIAVLPGISRSGVTITTGLGLELDRETSASFSFILSLPAILGATILEITEVDFSNVNITGTIIAFLVSLIIGYLSLKILMRFIKRGKFFYFGFYVLLASALAFVFHFVF